MNDLKKAVLYLSPPQIAWLAENKLNTGVSISATIRLALDAYIATSERKTDKPSKVPA